MIALLIPVLLPATVAGILLARSLGPAPGAPLEVAGRAAAALVLGQGGAALLAFAWLLAGGALDRTYAAVEGMLLALALLPALRLARPRARPGQPPEALAILAVVVLALALASFGLALLQAFQASPSGGWDAWAIWNQRARFIHRAGAGWRAAFSPDLAWSHPEYPVGLPLMVARLHAYASETTLAPRLLAGLLTLAAPLILAAAVARRAGPVAGVIAALLLLATPGWLDLGALQYADVPVATFLLLGVTAAGAALERPAPPGAALVGGLALGLAGFTKNEGLAGAAWAFLAWGALAWSGRGRRAAVRELGAVAAGASLPALAWAAFHLSVSPEILPAFTRGPAAEGLLARGADPARWALILEACLDWFPGAVQWLPVVALALAGLLGLRAAGLRASPALAVAAAMYLQTLAMFAVTPHPLEWHLSTAMARLQLQPWPLLLAALFGAVRPPPSGKDQAPADQPPA